MTIYRKPVEGARLPFPLACVDIDPTTGLLNSGPHECRALQAGFPKSQRRPFFKCRNRKRYAEGKCDTLSFMYPRNWAGDGKRFRAHQGIDILAMRGAPIQSVAAGKVIHASREYKKGFGGYGMIVIVRSRDSSGRSIWFLYAHCDDIYVVEGEAVVEKQIIASVGTTYPPDRPRMVRPPGSW